MMHGIVIKKQFLIHFQWGSFGLYDSSGGDENASPRENATASEGNVFAEFVIINMIQVPVRWIPK